ncbi:MAG: hypothetical protein HN390_08240 [Anaerolineae bacterium]|jgi:hypothetical protein|nr:hypothetical protein [Anaerolineae bacterium]MBT7190618.1 hypothetical protein [Anaerolineae bacterium]MBT7992130.1 hypothetical protein [Anaerolineae bacterium]
MLKRIAFLTLYLIFVSALIWAAINRTTSIQTENGKNTDSNSTQEMLGSVSKTPTPSENAQDTHASEKTWEILTAKISALSNRGATLMLENESTISLNPRPWRFAQDQGLQAQLGDLLLLTGFYENEGEFEVVHLRNLDNGTLAQIRDAEGHPLWASGENGE